MPSFIIYLIKANIALTLFYLAYRFGLRRLTFYTLNRAFLLFGIGFSALYPLVNMQALFAGGPAGGSGVFYYSPDWHAFRQTLEPLPSTPAWTYIQIIFWIGVSLMALRFTIQLFSLRKIHRSTRPDLLQGERVRILNRKINPFSFLKYIYINPDLYSDKEIANILSHEKVHVHQWHSIDILLAELNHLFYWFNPGAWMMKTAIKENLEFIADQKVLIDGHDPRMYQYSLIKLSTGSFPLAIANHFNISNLKIRIKMMNRQRSPGYMLLRYLLAVPVILITIFIVWTSEAQKNSQHDNTVILKTDTSRILKNIPASFYFNDKGFNVRVKESTGETYVLQKNGVETGPYHLYDMDEAAIKQFNEKYGTQLTYREAQEHKAQANYLKSHPEITKYSYSSDTRILIWTGNTSKIYDISRSYDKNLLLAKYGSIPPKFSWLNFSQLPRVQFTPPKPRKDTVPKNVDERATYNFHENFLKRHTDIKTYRWKSGADRKPAILIIELKNGKEEIYDMRKPAEAKEAERKYGTFPLPPPPPTAPPAPPKVKPITPPPPPPTPSMVDEKFKMDYDHFLQKNKSVKSLGWNGSEDQGSYTLIVHLKNGIKETYNLLDKGDAKKAHEKYGELPIAPPPPPPPAPGKVQAPTPPPPPPAPRKQGNHA